eukprot:1161124-Pelagomonas_calceolata.AAC.10
MDLRVPQDNGAGYATLWSQLIRQWLFVHAVNVTLLLAFTHCMAPSHSTFLLAGGRLRPPPVLDHGKDITKSRTVADFGLSRVLDLGNDTIQTKTYGTVTYMPPELLMEGKMTKACDVYGYGVIVW